MRTCTRRLIIASSGMALFCLPLSSLGVVVLGNGEQINLAALLDPASDHKFRVYDKIFTIESFTSNQFQPQNITVIGIIQPINPLECIGFDLTGGFGDSSPGDNIIHEFNLQYTVEITEPDFSLGFRIKDNSLLFNGTAVGIGSFAQVDETVLDPTQPAGSQLVGNKRVFARVDDTGMMDSRLEDSLLFNPPYYRLLEINKDAKFFAVEGGQASASLIRQCFSQIPNPGAAMPLAALAYWQYGRRRRQA